MPMRNQVIGNEKICMLITSIEKYIVRIRSERHENVQKCLLRDAA